MLLDRVRHFSRRTILKLSAALLTGTVAASIPPVRTMSASSIQDVALSKSSVGHYELLELSMELATRYTNPYEPSEVTVDGVFTAPSGKQFTVPGFIMQDYIVSTLGGDEQLNSTGWPRWKVRFAPVEIGEWSVMVKVRDQNGTSQSQSVQFACIPSNKKGYVQVNPQDTNYFQYANGQDFFCIGLNSNSELYHFIAKHNDLFAKMQQNGMNWVRVWMPPIEREGGTLGNYDQQHAYRVDALVAAAEKHDIYINLCLDWWRNFDVASNKGVDVVDHTYWVGRGGHCKIPKDFFTLEWAKAQYKKRLRYIVARWGYSQNVFAWELWNEIETVVGYEPDYIVAWTHEMAQELKRIDPWKHLVTTSFGSYYIEPTMWRLPSLDFTNAHAYYHPEYNDNDYDVQIRGRDMADFVSYWLRQLRDFGKPALQAEFGLVNEAWGVSEWALRDTEGISIHNGLWAAVHSGSAGTAMYWWTFEVLNRLKMFHIYKPLSAYLQDVQFGAWKLRPHEISTNQPQVRCLGLKSDRNMLVWIHNKQHTWWNQVVEKKPLGDVSHVQLELGPLEQGKYQIEVWDTRTGKVVQSQTINYTNTRRHLQYQLPLRVSKDVALKVRWLGKV